MLDRFVSKCLVVLNITTNNVYICVLLVCFLCHWEKRTNLKSWFTTKIFHKRFSACFTCVACKSMLCKNFVMYYINSTVGDYFTVQLPVSNCQRLVHFLFDPQTSLRLPCRQNVLWLISERRDIRSKVICTAFYYIPTWYNMAFMSVLHVHDQSLCEYQHSWAPHKL